MSDGCVDFTISEMDLKEQEKPEKKPRKG